MRQLYQDGGPFGPKPPVNPVNARFTAVANPGVYARFPRHAQQLAIGYRPVSQTNAGRTGIGCCSDCSATNRQS